MNKVILIGNLGKDAEVLRKGESYIIKFSLATQESFKDKSGDWQNVTEWHNCVMFSNYENASKGLLKGAKVSIVGKIKYSQYTSKDGVKKYKTDIIVKELTKLISQSKDESAGDYQKNNDDDLPF